MYRSHHPRRPPLCSPITAESATPSNLIAQRGRGPNLAGVFLRKAGTLPGFHYSPGFLQADFVWDDAHLDAWLTDPQKLIPGALMRYRQADPAIRGKIIEWLKEQH